MKVVNLTELADNRLLSRYNKKDGNNTIINNINNFYSNTNKYSNPNSGNSNGSNNSNANSNGGLKGVSYF